MSEKPDSQGPPFLPEIPKNALWTALALPPLATLAGNLIVGVDGNAGDYGTEFLWVPVLAFFILLILLPVFHQAIKTRYQGRSLVFLNLAYFLGQVIVCLTIWLGSCMLIAK